MAKIACKDYTVEDRRNAAVLFAQYGSWTMVGEKLGIPRTTVSHWENDDEFQAVLVACRRSITAEHIQTHLNLVTKAQEVMAERLANGDWKVVSGGKDNPAELVCIPVSLKDASLTMAIAQDKAQILQMRPTSISATDDRLVKLAERLGAIARQQEAKTVEGAVVDSFVDKSGNNS